MRNRAKGRVLDRLVGFKNYPEILWRKVKKQAFWADLKKVAVKLVVEKEREIQEFVNSVDVLVLEGHSSP